MDFDAERDRARAYLNRYYRATAMRPPRGSSLPGAARLPYAERWAVEVEVWQGDDVVVMTLEVHVPRDFPLHPPRVYLSEADHSEIFPVPHVDDERFVCTFDSAETVLNPEAAGDIAVAVVEKAAKILQDGLSEANDADYDAEVIAYWTQSYNGCGPADRSWLSLVDDDLSTDAYVLTTKRSLGRFSHVIHVGDALADLLKASLEADGNTFTETKAFVVDSAVIGKPPYGLRNTDALALIEAAGQTDDFKRYLRGKPEPATVLFQAKMSSHVLGWQHPRPPKPSRKARRGYDASRLSPYGALEGPDHATPVRRVVAEPYTPDRLHARTAGVETSLAPERRLFVAGLGSLGARLADSLTGVASTFGLLDPDVLSVENVGRHLLGLDAVGQNKASALAARFRAADPLTSVDAISDLRLAEAVAIDPTLLDGYDRAIITVGDLPTELWLDAEMADGRVRTPALYLWVEPLLAGGHCVFVRPGEARLSDLFSDGRYHHDVITSAQHDARPFTRREAGCQTTFVPYADTHVRMFLAAIYPHVLDAIKSDERASFRLRWTGDVNALRARDIEIADDVETPFDLTVVPL